jgi:hypothetical protein
MRHELEVGIRGHVVDVVVKRYAEQIKSCQLAAV